MLRQEPQTDNLPSKSISIDDVLIILDCKQNLYHITAFGNPLHIFVFP